MEDCSTQEYIAQKKSTCIHQQKQVKGCVCHTVHKVLRKGKEKGKTTKLVITKGYGVQATTIKRQNAFAPTLHTLLKFHVTDGQNMRDQIVSDRRS